VEITNKMIMSVIKLDTTLWGT